MRDREWWWADALLGLFMVLSVVTLGTLYVDVKVSTLGIQEISEQEETLDIAPVPNLRPSSPDPPEGGVWDTGPGCI